MNNYTIYSVDSAYMLLYSIYCSEQVFLKASLGDTIGVKYYSEGSTHNVGGFIVLETAVTVNSFHRKVVRVCLN